MPEGSPTLAGWRRVVADLYAAVRRDGADEASWRTWRTGRDRLLATHPDTPVPGPRRSAFNGMAFFPYDPSWRLLARVEPSAGDEVRAPDGTFSPIGQVVGQRGDLEIRLPLLWLQGYGGGLFLPFRDATNGIETYGGGRYLLDQVKGADLGAEGDLLVLDFNFAYHPSCAHDARWTCPLAPPGSSIPVPVRAGEMAPPQ